MTDRTKPTDRTKLIVYACPTGPLATQLEAYFACARAEFSPNPAHDYMPHITLTGFFSEVRAAVPHYIDWLDAAHTQTLLPHLEPPHTEPPHTEPPNTEPLLTVVGMKLEPDFHGLEIVSPRLQTLIQTFIAQAHSPTRAEAIRPKDWLHLSLAYGFPAAEDKALRQLAITRIDPQAPASWVLRLYEYTPERVWIRHAEWPL